MTNKLEELVFVGFNKQVIALDRYTGEKKWEWKSPKGSGYPSILLDGDRLIVSVHGYTFCLEPTTGALVWENELKGHGTGITCLVSTRGSSSGAVAETTALQTEAAMGASGAGVSGAGS